MIKLIVKGFRIGLRQYQIACIVYFVQFMFAFIIGMQVFQVMDASIGQSLELEKLITNYDHTVVGDFLNVHGGSISPLFGQLRWMVLIYIIVSVFMNGGILSAVTNSEFGWKAFWQGGANYFFPFFRIALFFGSVFLIWTFLLIMPALGAFTILIEALPSEIYYFGLLSICFIVYSLGVIFLFNWSVISRTRYIKTSSGVWNSIKTSFTWCIKRWIRITILILLGLLVLAIIFTLYFAIAHGSGMINPALIVLFFIFQQGIAWFRIVWKISMYSCLTTMYLQ